MTINATLRANKVKGRLTEFKVRFTANIRLDGRKKILFPDVLNDLKPFVLIINVTVLIQGRCCC